MHNHWTSPIRKYNQKCNLITESYNSAGTDNTQKLSRPWLQQQRNNNITIYIRSEWLIQFETRVRRVERKRFTFVSALVLAFCRRQHWSAYSKQLVCFDSSGSHERSTAIRNMALQFCSFWWLPSPWLAIGLPAFGNLGSLSEMFKSENVTMQIWSEYCDTCWNE